MNNIITIIVAVIASTGFWTVVNGAIERRHRKTSNVTKAILALLHDRIYELAKEYIATGSISDSEHKNLTMLYEPYKAMGGNGTAEKLMHEVDKLPIKED